MFNFDESEMILAENIDYCIFGDNYKLEFSVYLDIEEENYKYALLEESYLDHQEVNRIITLTKTKENILNVLEDRKTTLESRTKGR